MSTFGALRQPRQHTQSLPATPSGAPRAAHANFPPRACEGGKVVGHPQGVNVSWEFRCTDEELVLAAEAFREDGVVCLRGAFDAATCKLVAEGIAANMANPSELGEWIGGDKSRFFSDLANWRQIPQFEQFARGSGAAELVRKVMGSNVAALYHEHVLVKESGVQPGTPWHQDQSYYPVDGQQLCSIWMPVDAIPQEASLQFVRGSHAWGKWYIPRKFASGNQYECNSGSSNACAERTYHPVPDVDQLVAAGEVELMSWAVEPGDCLIFHGMAMHGTAPRVAAPARRVLSTRWVGEDAHFARRPWEFSPPGVMGALGFGDHLVDDPLFFPTCAPAVEEE
eukprot:jgi/Tetstr1/421669/TSEL_012608.t1